MIKNKINKLIIVITAIFAGMLTGNAAADVGYPVFYQEIGGAPAYCVDANYSPVTSEKALSKCIRTEINGESLNKAMALGDYNKTQLAMRIIAMKSGYTKSPKKTGIAIKNGTINNGNFQTIYKQFINEAPIQSTEGIVKMEVKDNGQTDQDYNITVVVSGPAGVELTIKDENGNVWGKGTGNFSINRTLKGKECEGINVSISAYGTNTNLNTSGCVAPRDTYYYYNCGKGLQNYIIPVKGGTTIPGDDCNNPNDNGALGTYDISIADKNCECGAEYSGDFYCDGSGNNKEYLKETNNILSCVTSGHYKKYCNESVKKENDKGKTISTIAGHTTNDIDLTKSNKYCSVYCVEDIEYDLPGEIEVKNGSYFTLANGTANGKVKISGKRRCYTDMINKELFVLDIKEKQSSIIKEYNDYLKKKALFERMKEKPAMTNEMACQSQSCNNNRITSGATVNVGVYDVGSVYYKQIECVYNSSTGAAICTPKQANEVIKVKETLNGSTQIGTCGKGVNKQSYLQSCGVPAGDLETKWENKKKEYENYESHLTNAISLSKELETMIGKYKSCSNWTNNYCFDPKITFNYDDGEIYGNNEQELQSSGATIGGQNLTYFSNVNDKYEGAAVNYSEQNVKYVYVQNKDDYDAMAQIDFNVKYVKSTVEASKEFTKGDTQVCTYHPYGTIIINKNNECSGKNTVMLGGDGYVFPVALEKSEERKYNYDLVFSNIGVSGNDASCANAQKNRLMGCTDANGKDVYTEETQKEEAKYTCHYSSCPDCEVDCKCPPNKPGCFVEDGICYYADCPDCEVKCVGCLWNNGNSTFAYKPVSLSDVFPNSTNNKDVGYNWNTDSNVNPQSEKAEKTIEDIEEKGQNAYKKPEYSYTLTPTTMAKIRAYNDAANSGKKEKINVFGDVDPGGYNNDTLVCTNGEKCRSSFLNALDKIVGKGNYIRSEEWKVFKNGEWKIEK